MLTEQALERRKEVADGTTSAEADVQWEAVLARDAAADGTFVYSVRTTGVYCRPSCASRQARRENIQFHASCVEAEQAGFRPCKRCRPDQAAWSTRYLSVVTSACQALQTDATAPNLKELARAAGLSAYHFHRLFTTTIGMTPKAYATAYRARMLRDALAGSESVTEAMYAAGFSSGSRFYEAADRTLGMKPSRFRAKGANTVIRFAIGECSLGSILVAQSERGICAVLMGDDPESLMKDLTERFARADLQPGDAEFQSVVAKVVAFVESPRQAFELPLAIRGTAFQARVWQALQEIPVGSTATYTEVAQRIGRPEAVRAVAQACGANPLAVVVPCHRVVRSDGGLSGYRWGIERKRALLQREQGPSGEPD